MPIIDKQMKFVELGRLRMGAKGAKGQPEKLATWRLTSASRQLLDAAALVYGGTVRDWQGAPNEGYFELVTEAAELDVTIPPISAPGALLSQWYELWAAGGCKRRCDGVTEGISGKPCLCDAERRECKTVTRMSVMLPKLPGIGVWRLDTGGLNAALELPGTFQFLADASNGRFVEATLRIEPRVKKVDGEKFPRRFTVPVLNVPSATVGQLLEGSQEGRVLGPAQPVVRRPELSAGAPPSEQPFQADEKPGFGEPPPLPTQDSSGEGAESDSGRGRLASTIAPERELDDQGPGTEAPIPAPPDNDVKLMTPAKKQKLDILVGKLREAGHITTSDVYHHVKMEPLPSDYDEDGVLHYAPLRDRLPREVGEQLLSALSAYADSVGDGSYFERRAAEVRGS